MGTLITNAVWDGMRRHARTIVVVDVVESVRLMQANEADVIDRWRRFVNEVVTQVLPAHGGRLVKSLGDGMLLEFESVPPAVASALDIQRRIQPYNAGYAADGKIHLRVGAHVTDVVVDALDIYGSGVNLAARIAGLAGPDEFVVSAEVRDSLVPGLDAELEDLGDCFVKHVAEPVRVYRVGGPGPQPEIAPASSADSHLVPTVAVMPLNGRMLEPQFAVVGELIADTVIVHLSRYKGLRVISRLSTSTLSNRDIGTQQRQAHAALRADYVLAGFFSVLGTRIVVTVELLDTRSGDVIWAERLTNVLGDLFEPESELAHQLCAGTLEAIEQLQMQRARTQPLPTLDSFSLQFGAVSLMHRASRRDFDRVHGLLEHLVERHPRLPTPRAWLAKWHVLRVTRGMASDVESEARIALALTQRALQSDPHCALALAMEGFVHCHMRRDLDAAAQRYEMALETNPNESIAWLFKSVLHAFQGQGESAVEAAERAIALSPLDPLRYYYDSLAASAALSAQRYERALELATRSLRANRTHSSTLRVLVMAQALTGRHLESRQSAQELLRVEPQFSVHEFMARSPAARFEIGQVCAAALRMAGIPE